MKNIHILPTDKPSRLVKFFTNKLHLCKEILPIQDEEQYQHIYITSDEEIKDVRPHKGKWQLEKGEILNKFPNYLTDLSECKLVIITTDQDLIKDGVQAIDDEFLEWFVKNPSCEEVEVDKNWNYPLDKSWEYKIIIPKEEPFIEYTNTNDCTSMIYNPKEETLEEDLLNTAIQVVGDNNITTIKEFLVKHKWQAENYGLMEIELRHTKTLLASCEKALDERDKQQERMYSEEEVFNLCREFAIFVQRNGPSYKKQQEWFEQFKKK